MVLRPSSLVPVAFLLLLSASHSEAVVLYTEDFDSGAGTFSLNTSDLGSTANGENSFVVNDSYTGGSGTVNCLGFPFLFTVANTPVQPSGPSNYLHTLSRTGSSNGLSNSSFAAADGLCFFPENIFARMDVDVDTTGFENVELDFLWAFGGGTAIHGEVYYSTNSGTSWNLITDPISQYKNQSTWANQTIGLDVFSNQSTLRFGFRMVNGVSTAASDPGFSLDDIRISGDPLTSEVPEPTTIGLMATPLALLWLRKRSMPKNRAQ